MREIKAATQIEQGSLAYTVGNAIRVDQAVAVIMLATVGGACFGASDKHADTLAGEVAAVNGGKVFYGTTFLISGAEKIYLIDYIRISNSEN